MDETVLFYRKKHDKTILRGTRKATRKQKPYLLLNFAAVWIEITKDL
jgi:hypothetical protein